MQEVIEAELMKKTGMPRFGLPADDGDDDVNATYVVRCNLRGPVTRASERHAAVSYSYTASISTACS